jgi:Uncharacterized conserved protein
MTKTITVKGIGKVSAKPDLVVLSMNLDSQAMKYDRAMRIAEESIALLTNTLVSAGFEKDDIKTTSFDVRTEYNNERQTDGSYKRVFDGYMVSHSLKVEFDFDSERLSKAVSVIGSCVAAPQLSVQFTVKDPTAINEELLKAATNNAHRKAEILCEAAGKKLGELLSIDYNWGEVSVYSRTSYNIAEDCMAAPMMAKSIEFEPDDIDLSDTATFVWEIN